MTEPTRGTFDADDRAIPYADAGDGPTLVLLPGGSLNITYLASLASALVEEHFRVVRIGSRRPSKDATSTITMHDLAQDVVDVMDHLGIEHSWVGGHAFGNRVARAIGLDHTDRVNGILLLAAGGTVQPSGKAKDALKTVFSSPTDQQVMDAMPYLVGNTDPDHAWKIVKPSLEPELGPMQAAAVANTPAQEWAALPPGVPVLILQSSDDQIAPGANGEQLKESAPDQVSLVTIDGGGHLFAATKPGETAAAIEDYLDWD
ncbi:alpha/beta fold hydrolase [Microbacterium sp.]|uniref:alpha/beta fold hydrolase n=1 Tax=Microbacterium sp. TaxID=51671 RepID=UPI003A889063